MLFSISRAVLDAVLADARLDPARERCGLLLGAGDVCAAAIPAANVAADPARHFELDPAVLIAAERAARRGGPAVIGHYHSHPVGACAPSLADAAAADVDGRYWLIITATDAAVWRSGADGAVHGRFDSVAMRIIA